MDIAVIRVLLKQPFPSFVLTMNDGRTFEIHIRIGFCFMQVT